MPSTEQPNNSGASPSEKKRSSDDSSKRPDPFFQPLSKAKFKELTAEVRAIQEYQEAAGLATDHLPSLDGS